MRAQAKSAVGFPERSAAAPEGRDLARVSEQPKLPPEGILSECLRRAGAWLRRHRPLARAFGAAVAALAAGVCAARRGA